jgi:hypothetical protein
MSRVTTAAAAPSTPSNPMSWAWTTVARTSRRNHTATQAYASNPSRERQWPVNSSTSPLLEHLGEIVRQSEPMPAVLAENDGGQTTSVHAPNWSAPCQLTSCTESSAASPDRLHPGRLPPNGVPQCHGQQRWHGNRPVDNRPWYRSGKAVPSRDMALWMLEVVTMWRGRWLWLNLKIIDLLQ